MIDLISIPAGKFLMGSTKDEIGHLNNEFPRHLVSIQAFKLGKTPVTQEQWREVAKWRPEKDELWGIELNPYPSYFIGDNNPVDSVSWHESIEFCNRLSQRTGHKYTLPNEAQWEYACRAGTTTPFCFGDTITTELGNYYDDSKDKYNKEKTTPVGIFPANNWGLHDMHGNVWEWCLDHWHNNYKGAPTDGSAWLKSSDELRRIAGMRVQRGGSAYNVLNDARSASRGADYPHSHNRRNGFRVCRLD